MNASRDVQPIPNIQGFTESGREAEGDSYENSKVTFVSAYYTLESTPYFNKHPEEWDPAPIFDLARIGIQLCLYIGPNCAFETAFTELERECPNFRVMPYRLHYKDMCIYQELEKWNRDPPLPASRNLEKDTLEYMIYMNSRPEIMEDAISENPWDSTHFAWIDFNTSRLFSKKAESLNRLLEISRYSFPTGTTYLAGCWPKLDSNGMAGITKNIYWRFCGAFFLADTKTMMDFAELCRKELPTFLREYGTFTWEVNYWAWLECTHGEVWNPVWYKADHNDSLTHIFSGISADTYATILSPETDIVAKKTYAYPEIDPFLPGSASYLEHAGSHYLNTRFVNYWMFPNGYYRFHNADMVIENRNFLSRLDATTFETVDYQEMRESALYSPTGQPLQLPAREKRPFSVGLEDIRLFSGKMREADGTRPIRFIATNVEYSPSNKNRMVIGTYDIESMTYKDCFVAVPPDPNSWCEKNWIPVIQRDGGEEKERFIYKWSPMEIGEIDPATNQLNIVLQHEVRPWIFSRLRGSTTFVDAPLAFLPQGIDGGAAEYLVGLAHFSEEHSPRHYYHTLILLDKATLKPLRYSRVFYFEKLSIEFCVGMTTKTDAGGTYVFWISRFDRDPIMIEVKKDALSFDNVV